VLVYPRGFVQGWQEHSIALVQIAPSGEYSFKEKPSVPADIPSKLVLSPELQAKNDVLVARVRTIAPPLFAPILCKFRWVSGLESGMGSAN
jgi:hypothetical protein